MTEPMLDVLTYTRDLENAGFNRTQAEAIARGNSTMLAQRFETLVTREHFDVKMEVIEGRFAELDRRIERMEKSLDPIKIQVNLLTWMMGLVVLVLVVPQLQSWFAAV